MKGASLDAIEAVYRSRYGVFVRVATAITGDTALAEDAVHETFVRAVRDRTRFRGEGPLEAWLWRILVNDARKRRAAAARLVPLVGESTTGRSTNGDAGRLRGLVAALPERQRHVLFLRYYADLDYEAVATALGISAGTVAATLHAARAALRRELTEVDP